VSMATVSKGSAIGSEGTEWPRVLRGGAFESLTAKQDVTKERTQVVREGNQ
jgi:hypothetical protein